MANPFWLETRSRRFSFARSGVAIDQAGRIDTFRKELASMSTAGIAREVIGLAREILEFEEENRVRLDYLETMDNVLSLREATGE